METVLKDIRYGVRSLLKQPAFTAVAVITLALGIGANTAIFSVVNAVLLRQLPVNNPRQLVFLSNPDRHGVNGGQETGDRRLFAYHEFEFLRSQNQVFSGVAAVQSSLPTTPVTVVGPGQSGETERARVSMVSGGYFSVLGVNAVKGRTFTAELDRIGSGDPVAVISYSYWKNRFSLDASILGRRLLVGKASFEIIGVAQPEFSGETVGFAPDAWIPLTMQPDAALLAPPKDVRNKYMWLQVVARLKPEVTVDQATAGINLNLKQMLESEASQLSAGERSGYLNQRIALADGSQGASTLRTSFGKPLLILMGLAGLVLLIACSNVANLLLARAASRQKEIAVRVALGAGRRRVIQTFLTESLLLALMGGALGLLLAQWADVLLLRLVSSGGVPVALDLRPDTRMFGFTLAVSTLTGILFGLAPALRAARVDLNSILKGTATGAVGGVSHHKGVTVGKVLVVGQVALSLISLIVAGLLVHSFQKLTSVELGYDSDHLLQFGIYPSPDTYKGPPNQLHQQLLTRIQTVPGVDAASLSLTGFFGLMNSGMNISIEGYAPAPGEQMAGGAGHRLRSALVMTEIALAVVLLVGAGLMMKSLLHLLQTNVGFNPEKVLTMTVSLPAAKYTDVNQQINFFDQLTERVRTLPGVTGAGTIDRLPLQPGNTTRFIVDGDPVPPPGQETEANMRIADESYFQTLGVPIIAGRMFDSRDKADAPGVVIIGKTTADKVFGGRDPVGRRIKYASVQSPPDLIIGVVADVKIGGLDDTVRPVLYYPFRQSASTATNLVIRTSNDPAALTAAVRSEISRLETDVAVFNVNPMEQLISNSPAVFLRRFPALIIGIFAGVALLLASIGIYGVVSYSVSQQTHYIGVRMALGAQTSDIMKMVLKQGLILALLGVGIGVVAALGLMRLLRSLLFQVQTNDAATFAIVTFSLIVVAVLACYIPARRATKVDPLVALRYE